MSSIVRKFVNGCLNVCWISGYVRRQDTNSVRICASTDAETGTLVNISPTMVIPPNDEYTEVECHVFGHSDPKTGRMDLRIDALQFKRPNISAVPRKTLMQAAAGIRKPMASIAEIREGLMKEAMSKIDAEGLIGGMTPDQLVSDMVREAQRGAPNRGSSFTNKVILTGFIGEKRVVLPTEQEDAHILLRLHQHGDLSKAIPLRIYGNVAAFSKDLKTLFPINVVGSVAFRDVETDGQIVRERFIATSRKDIGMATRSDFYRREFPDWWMLAFAEHRKRAQARRATIPGRPLSDAAPGSSEGTTPDLEPGL